MIKHFEATLFLVPWAQRLVYQWLGYHPKSIFCFRKASIEVLFNWDICMIHYDTDLFRSKSVCCLKVVSLVASQIAPPWLWTFMKLLVEILVAGPLAWSCSEEILPDLGVNIKIHEIYVCMCIFCEIPKYIFLNWPAAPPLQPSIGQSHNIPSDLLPQKLQNFILQSYSKILQKGHTTLCMDELLSLTSLFFFHPLSLPPLF